MKNQRQFLRKSLDSTVSVFESESHEYVGLLVDCSERGCMISSASPLPTATEYHFTIVDLPVSISSKRSGNLTLKAMWSDKITATMYGTGFELVNSSDKAKLMFQDYLNC